MTKDIALRIPADFKAEYTDGLTGKVYALTAEQLMNVATLAYVITNGYRQSLTDAAAFNKADKEGKSPDDLKAMTLEARDKRDEAIKAGTVGTGGSRGPTRKGLDWFLHDVAVRKAEAIAKEKGLSVPKDPKARKEVLDRIKARPDVQAAAKAAYEADSAITLDLDDNLFEVIGEPKPKAGAKKAA